MQEIYTLNNLKETKKLAKEFAYSLNGGEVVLLVGEMGAGKTTFAGLVFDALGFKGIVNSPTFTIMQQYMVKKFKLVHFDLYRLENTEEGYNFGLEEYILNRDINTITFIEWPDRLGKLLKGDFLVVNIEKSPENDQARTYKFTYENF